MLALIPGLALVVAGLALSAGGAGDLSANEVVGAAVAVTWSACGVVVWLRHRHHSLGLALLAVGVVSGGILLAHAAATRRPGPGPWLADAGVWVLWAGLAVLVGYVLAVLPDGRLRSRSLRLAIPIGAVAAVGVGLALLADRSRLRPVPLAAWWLGVSAVGLASAGLRYQRGGGLERRQLQWVGWALAVGGEAILVLSALHLVLDWPGRLGPAALALSALVPIAIVAASVPPLVLRVDRLLSHTVSLAGLTALVVGSYLAVLVVAGRETARDSRPLVLTAMALAGGAALVHQPFQRRLLERSNRVIYGERIAPEETLRTFGQRLTRAMPLDELLLQLVESLRKSMALSAAEVWTGVDGTYELVNGVPHRQAPPLRVGELERGVVARAGVSGGTWLDIWLAGLVAQPGLIASVATTRAAPLTHQGELLGLIVCTRPADGEPFTDNEDVMLSELARQVALALHNVRLDSALQASLEQLRQTNDELRTSRSRIVAAGDAERRKLERDLHDGAQQRLVAVAVKLRLARDAVADGEDDAVELVEETRADLQAAIAELRSLAHGIFPPLLMSGGLAEALPAAAGRAALPTSVDVEADERFPADVEAAVYFCCLEALQNAGKHAGEGATAYVRLWRDDGTLRFSVTDDGAGFVPGTARGGHGFLNMADRLGAFGGSVIVDSRPGEGTSVNGQVPLGA